MTKQILLYALTIIICTVNKVRTTLNVGDVIPEGISDIELEYLKKNGKVSDIKPSSAQQAATPQATNETLKKALQEAENAKQEALKAQEEVKRLEEALAAKEAAAALVNQPITPEPPPKVDEKSSSDTKKGGK